MLILIKRSASKNIIQLVEPAGNKEEKMLKYEIGIALGKKETFLLDVNELRILKKRINRQRHLPPKKLEN